MKNFNIIDYYKKHPLTATLLLGNLIMFLLTIFSGGFSANNLVRLGAMVPERIKRYHEYQRFLLMMFLHGGWLHFIMNSYFLYYFGTFLEKLFGSSRFALIYFISGLASSLIIFLFDHPLSVTIGASGALFGILGTLLVLTLTKKHWFNHQQVNSIRYLTIINLIITFLIPNISIYGHVGGFVSGAILAYFIAPKHPHFLMQPDEYYLDSDV